MQKKYTWDLRRLYSAAVLFASLLGAAGCYKELLPDEQDHLSNNMNYTTENFVAVLGETNVFINVFNADYSTQPLTFTLENVRTGDKQPAPILRQQVDTRQWKTWYSGFEKTIDEIMSKTFVTKRPILDIRENSGEIIFWNVDSNTVAYGKYYFDVRVKNKAGERVFTNLTLDVRRPHPYEPYTIDDITGIRKPLASGGLVKAHDAKNVRDYLQRLLPRDSIDVFFVKTGEAKNTVSVRFFNPDSTIIPLTVFDMQRWDSLYYYSPQAATRVKFGFNQRFDTDSTIVTWDIPNPFPVLTDVSGGLDMAQIGFDFKRVNFGRQEAGYVMVRFAIKEPGEWTVAVKFRQKPKFEDD